jgi:Capsule assembly protein Wzi
VFRIEHKTGIVFVMLLFCIGGALRADASTYVVYIPLDSPIYDELDTLNSLGMLETYLEEIKPIARVEAARLTLEAERIMSDTSAENAPSPALPLAKAMVVDLRAELAAEISWLENDAEDDQPSMLVPLSRIEAQYVYSSGPRRTFGPLDQHNEQLYATEATPLLPNNDDLPTSVGSNEVARASAWAGLKGFFTAYAEGALAGPLTSPPAGLDGSTSDRARLLGAEAVADFGNEALSFGQHEMFWGTGYFNSMSQSNNAQPFPALRLASVHPSYLPGFLRYLGPFRHELFFGELGHYRPYVTQPLGTPSRSYPYPWLAGQIVVFKPLSTFELGITHVIMFGGRFNNNYSLAGFLGRATGFDTGSPNGANTNSEAGFTTKFYFPSLRNAYLYLDVLGEDNLTSEVPKIGGALPFAAVSYQGGIFVPRVTADGLTTARLEFLDTSQRYSFHGDSLYWAYQDRLMGNAVGPNAFQINLDVGRWLSKSVKLDVDYFHTERDPEVSALGGDTEFSNGASVTLLRLPQPAPTLFGIHNLLGLSVYMACEQVRNLNTVPGSNGFRAVVQLSFSLTPTNPPIKLDNF